MYKRVFSGGYPYFKGEMLVRSSSVEPIYSYGKNYEKFGKKFGLFVWTTNGDEELVEKLFEASLKNVKKDTVSQVEKDGSFLYI